MFFPPSAFRLPNSYAPCSLPIHSIKRSAHKVKRSSSAALCFSTFRIPPSEFKYFPLSPS
ncbi:hypothetical protein D1AOALGA4SA_411 [Olavius algarvensis Delta 1 endosymbiont]|nr:hypothetical protein D1AOALGA4SA_411 [Olavius algarvensis Delta 1 endosymbiont]